MVAFKSLIVFDTETTSLPQFDHNTTKIIEFAFIGCEIEHLKDTEKLPRVLHKLVIPFNPNKLIHPKASETSGLTNELLENVEPFREKDVDFIRHFISRLPQPVCIVAHNGDKFDFPIFRRALAKLNKSLQNNVYCADSLKAFQCLIPKDTKNSLWSKRPNRNICNGTPINQRTQPTNSLNYSKVCRQLFPDEEMFEPFSTKDGPSGNEVCRQLFPDEEMFEPFSTKDGPSGNEVCRQLLPDEEFFEVVSTLGGGEYLISSQNVSSLSPKSYKLKDIYYFYFGEYFPDSHRAEEDSKALLSCIKSCDGFCDWMNENAVVFNTVEPLS